MVTNESLPEEAESSETTAFERVQLARHADRPYALDFVEKIFTGFFEIHGDRRFSDDAAIICGMASYHGEPVMVIGQQKGRDMKQRSLRNFGMPKPEGYRKALRAMKTAEKFGRPVISFIDTFGAYPGIDAEERGQAEAIAYNLREMAKLKVPTISVVIGEGGSGGALGIGVTDSVLMLENAVYSVITPEGCAAILWKDASRAPQAAEALKITARDLYQNKLVDAVVDEPTGGGHMDPAAACERLDAVLWSTLQRLQTLSTEERLRLRRMKMRALGRWLEG